MPTPTTEYLSLRRQAAQQAVRVEFWQKRTFEMTERQGKAAAAWADAVLELNRLEAAVIAAEMAEAEAV